MSESRLCERCGAFGDMPHVWVESDCILPHRAHSTKLVPGTQVCEPCVERWDEWLAEIVDLYATLAEVVDVGSVPDDTAAHDHQKITGSPALLRLGAWALLHPEGLNSHVLGEDGLMHHTGMNGLPDVADVLHNHAQMVFDANGWTMDAPVTVSGASGVVRSNLTTLAGTPDVDTFDAELRWVRRSLRTAHGISDPLPVFRCISVDCSGQVWRMTAGSPQCDRCRRRYGTLDFVRAKRMQDQEAS